MLELTLGPFAGGSLGFQPAMDLDRSLLELGEPLLELTLGASDHRAFGRHGLLCFGQLPLDALQPAGQLARVALTRAHSATQPVDRRATLAVEL